MSEYPDKLKRRALSFLKSAKVRMEWGDYDLVCFDAEQAVQLYLKALLYKLFGLRTRTHGTLEHLGMLRRELGEEGRWVSDLVRRLRDGIDLLDESYVEGRYGEESEYTEEMAELCLKTAEEIIRRLREFEEELHA